MALKALKAMFLVFIVFLACGCLQGLKNQEAFEKRTRPPELVAAAMNGRLSDVERLVEAGRDVNERWLESTTPLMAAAVGDHYEIVEYLLLHGANPNLRDKAGDTVLDIAIRSHAKKTVRVLRLKAGNTRRQPGQEKGRKGSVLQRKEKGVSPSYGHIGVGKGKGSGKE